jgi:hypothetical protein
MTCGESSGEHVCTGGTEPRCTSRKPLLPGPTPPHRREAQPGALFVDREGRLIGVMVLDVAEGQIQAVSSIVNPDKLRHLGPLADLGALLRGRS